MMMGHPEFNEDHIPLAYLITFRCYGTWLHGDKRGSVDQDHNIYGAPFLSRDEKKEDEERRRLKQDPVELGDARREAVEKAIREVCEHRGWLLRAINVRTNHVHVVVSAQCQSHKILNDFKAYGTRGMRKEGVWESKLSPWAEHGSRRYPWTPRQVDRACDYVIHHQGNDLIPDLDDDDCDG